MVVVVGEILVGSNSDGSLATHLARLGAQARIVAFNVNTAPGPILEQNGTAAAAAAATALGRTVANVADTIGTVSLDFATWTSGFGTMFTLVRVVLVGRFLQLDVRQTSFFGVLQVVQDFVLGRPLEDGLDPDGVF